MRRWRHHSVDFLKRKDISIFSVYRRIVGDRAEKQRALMRLQIEAQPAVLSFPRKRESIISSVSYWMPAFAGMTGNCAG